MDEEKKEVKKKKAYEKPSYEVDEIIEKLSLACAGKDDIILCGEPFLS